MRNHFGLLGLMLYGSGVIAADCPVVKLSEDVNVFRMWVALISKVQVEITDCMPFRVDVSDYMEGGSALEGRAPSNLLYVQIEEAGNRFEISQPLIPSDRIIEVNFSIGRLVQGTSAPRALAKGQSVMFGIGEKIPTNFNSYLLAHGDVK